MRKVVLLLGFAMAFGLNGNAQILVKVKPLKPKVVVVKPNRPNPNHIWVEGHWVWSKKQNRYTWRKARWVKKRRGHVYVAGRWKATSNGHIWVAGGWKRR